MKKDEKQLGQNNKFQLFGWTLFIICAIFFILSSLRNRDTLTFIGSVIFLVACIVFLIPLFMSNSKNGE
ncbi:MAG: cytochrome oxidase subunit III [Deltaproteobacteria bacterium]|nr:cytochrome oxidase subunit III [Deltaproteobacteria bacterium]